jgi:hypothetical protein
MTMLSNFKLNHFEKNGEREGGRERGSEWEWKEIHHLPSHTV